MNDLGAAQQVRDGTLPSPTKFGKAWLFAIRISGTGTAERPALGEATYRPPEVWTGAEMLQRANGLPVLLGHPEGGLLTSNESAMRHIGACVLPYAQDGELWSIARVIDEAGFHAMRSGQFSTSPGVALGPNGGTKLEGAAGTLMIEKDPALLDHVAIVSNNLTTGAGGGVWDRGCMATGIRNDSISTKDKAMADDTNAAADDVSAKLDKLVNGMGALTDMCGSLGARMDALEKSRADAAGEEGARIAAAERDRDGQRGKELAAAGERDTKANFEEERARDSALADAQSRADALAQAFGKRAPAPLTGERPLTYRKRMAQPFKRYSKQFGDVDLSTITDPAVFAGVESVIYADALAASANLGADVPAGELREITRVDDATGVRVTSFYGQGTFIGRLKRPSARVTAFHTPNRGIGAS